MKENKYFTHKELACPVTGVVKLAPFFLSDLIKLREEYGKPMTVNSCCRSHDHNMQVGGHPRSLHVYDIPYHPTGGTCAIDIHMPDGFDKGDLVQLALSKGWSVGVAKTYLHLDRRDYVGLAQTLYTY